MQPYSCQLFPYWELFIPTLGTKYSQTGNNHEGRPSESPSANNESSVAKTIIYRRVKEGLVKKIGANLWQKVESKYLKSSNRNEKIIVSLHHEL